MMLVKSDLVDVTSQCVDPVCQTSRSDFRSVADLQLRWSVDVVA